MYKTQICYIHVISSFFETLGVCLSEMVSGMALLMSPRGLCEVYLFQVLYWGGWRICWFACYQRVLLRDLVVVLVSLLRCQLSHQGSAFSLCFPYLCLCCSLTVTIRCYVFSNFLLLFCLVLLCRCHKALFLSMLIICAISPLVFLLVPSSFSDEPWISDLSGVFYQSPCIYILRLHDCLYRIVQVFLHLFFCVVFG